MNKDLCRTGRAALEWTRKDLAREAQVHVNGIVKFEGGGNLRQETLDKISQAFADHGVTFSAHGKVQRVTWKKE